MPRVPVAAPAAQSRCSVCAKPTPYLRGDGSAFCRKHRPAPPFWSPAMVQRDALAAYYGLLNDNANFLAQLAPLLDATPTGVGAERPPAAWLADVATLARRWGLTHADAKRDLLHSAAGLARARADPALAADLAPVYQLEPGARWWGEGDLAGTITVPQPWDSLPYDPTRHSPTVVRQSITVIVANLERDLLRQVEALEARARAAGYVDTYAGRRRRPDEVETLARRAYGWWALRLTEGEIAEQEEQRGRAPAVSEDTVHKSLRQWKRFFPAVPRRPAKGTV